jgi:integrase
MRRSDLIRLEWSNVNLAMGAAYLAKTKSRKEKWVLLTADMVNLLRAIPRKEGEARVFWWFSDNALSVAVGRAIRRAKIANFRLHDLRQHADSRIMPTPGTKLSPSFRLTRNSAHYP